MITTIFWHPDIFLHDRHANHAVMKNNRIETIADAVVHIPGVLAVQAEPVSRDQLELVHEKEYLNDLFEHAPTADGETYPLDPETVMNRYTMPAMLLSIGAIKMAVDAVHQGQAANAFCPVYAGHHAMPRRGMGFCFTNGIAIGAKYAATLGYTRIAVADFDTHSGNGTLIALKDNERFLFAETYQPGFPGRFISSYDQPKNIVRELVETGLSSRESWKQAWRGRLLPAIERFRPEIILVSAGFDAHENDPQGMTRLKDEDYTWITRELLRIQPRIVSALEGGYSLPDTARCARLHAEALAEARGQNA